MTGKEEQAARIREALAEADFSEMDFFEFEDIFEDADPLEFL